MIGYLGLGSDLGDRRAALGAALDALPGEGIAVLAVSSVWETEPVEVEGSAGFLNLAAAVGVDDGIPPERVLDRILAIEARAGRTRVGPNRPRVLDIDLLTLGEHRRSGGRLVLPHPRMWERRFVLAPLAEIAPGLRNPRTGLTVTETLAGLPERPWARSRGALDPLRAAPVYSRRL